MRKRDPETRYRELIQKQKKILEEYTASETEYAEHLLLWYKVKKLEMPDDEYRAVAFFRNKEYQWKRGALTLLYSMFERCMKELPKPDREIAFDLLAYRFKLYALTLEKGGYNG
jgi:hypothetical protein